MKKKNIHKIQKPGFKTPDLYFESLEDRVFDALKEDTALIDTQDTGFNTPDTYFESVEDRIVSRLTEQADLSRIKDTGFKAPDNYLEDVETNVFDTLNDTQNTDVVSLFSKRNMLYLSGIAAAILIMFSIFYNKKDTIDTLDLDVVETYLEQQDLDSYDIALLLSEDDLSEDNSDDSIDVFSEESLEEYLIDNVNLEDIIEQ